MERLRISEQDIINAVCVYIARKKQVEPNEVEVELMYDDDYGFSAETFVDGRKQVLITINLIEALRLWLDEYLNIDPYSGIELVLDDEEGIVALISESNK
ncbi:YxcD family protein [Peribacillus sp. NPDC097295]|uniref:YxcD family protein n=1 Tax=unclassified Peribacillus TaxID=2675266 RepID=UPI0038156BE4